MAKKITDYPRKPKAPKAKYGDRIEFGNSGKQTGKVIGSANAHFGWDNKFDTFLVVELDHGSYDGNGSFISSIVLHPSNVIRIL